ncbi:MAG: bifunctional aspartate kinase/homoserine dehydrogenase [Bacteroidota bacterium]|jgi:aspartokinase/homoserine dehydrogenase 1
MKLIKIEGKLLSTAQQIKEIVQLLKINHSELVTVVIAGDEEVEKAFENIAINSSDTLFDYSEKTNLIEQHVLNLTRNVLPITQQSSVLSFVKQRFNQFEDLCKGIQLLGEIPIKTIEEVRRIPSTLLAQIFFKSMSNELQDVSFGEISKMKNLHIIPSFHNTATYQLNEINHRSSDAWVANYAVEKNIKTVEFWKNKDQFFTADPHVVKNAKPISELGYEEAIELSNYDQHIIDPKALGLLTHHQIDVSVVHMGIQKLNTKIHKSASPKKEMITGISSLDEISLINIEGGGMMGVVGFAKRVFTSLFEARINVILISQGASEHSICIAVKSIHAHQASVQLSASFTNEINNGILKTIQVVNDTSIIALVGENMRSHPGISGRMFQALGRNGINVLAIAQGANEKNISAVIQTSDKNKALNVLHEAFFEFTKKEINAFIIGTGNVGKKLIGQIKQQFEHISSLQNIKLNIAGLCNRRKMLIDPEGIELKDWEEKLALGDPSNLKVFIEGMIELNLRNSVLIDITANHLIPEVYSDILKKSMSVVACNKIAASDSYIKYKELKDLALEYNCKFLFETNVGAALPIISTLNDIIKSGDKIQKIQAVLSGTLNYVFNHYDGQKPFAEVVRAAQNEGYTEPDPRLDLSGTDVMRKIMILAREAGYELEMEQIKCHSFLPERCTIGDVEDFYKEMLRHESHFQQLLNAANAKNSKLKFVASFMNGQAYVGLQHIDPENEMYHLYGKDNIVLFYTERYRDQPLVVKGAGAGADVTASGVFADILRTINH